MDGRTNGPTDGRTDGRTLQKQYAPSTIVGQGIIKNKIFEKKNKCYHIVKSVTEYKYMKTQEVVRKADMKT